MALHVDFSGVLIGVYRSNAFRNRETGEVRDAQWVAQVVTQDVGPLEGVIQPRRIEVRDFYLPNSDLALRDWVMSRLGRGVAFPVRVVSRKSGGPALYLVDGAVWRDAEVVVDFPGGLRLGKSLAPSGPVGPTGAPVDARIGKAA